MFGLSTSTTKPAAPPTEDDGPTFPLFLLPTLGFPFRRQRRRKSSSEFSEGQSNFDTVTEPEFYDSLSSVPSLSSSPESAAGVGSPDSPKSFKSFFPELPSLNQLRGFGDKSERKKSKLPPSDGPKLSRIQPDTLRCSLCSTDIAFCSQIVSKGFTGRYGRAYLVSPPSSQGTPSCPASPLNKTNNPKNTKVGADADLVNVRVGRPENRQLVTGQHVVADISCLVCESKLGWKYVDAREQAQKYKVGKFILETQRVLASHTWEDVDDSLSTISPTQAQVDEVGRDGMFATGQHAHQSQNRNLNQQNLNNLNGITGQGNGRQSTSSPSQSRGSPSTSTTNSRNNSTSSIPQSEEASCAKANEIVVFDSEDEDECDDIFAGVWDAEVVAKRRRHKVANIRRNGESPAASGGY